MIVGTHSPLSCVVTVGTRTEAVGTTFAMRVLSLGVLLPSFFAPTLPPAPTPPLTAYTWKQVCTCAPRRYQTRRRSFHYSCAPSPCLNPSSCVAHDRRLQRRSSCEAYCEDCWGHSSTGEDFCEDFCEDYCEDYCGVYCEDYCEEYCEEYCEGCC